jgi:asparagine synthase (glutamine-hydrolysing)
MSAFAGKYGFDGAPVNSGLPSIVFDFLKRRGPDKEAVKLMGQVVMAFCTFETTPEAAFEVQPFIFARRLILAWDGRLDNREQLAEMLGIPGNLHGDVSYIAEAYRKWGREFLAYIQGDYALCL